MKCRSILVLIFTLINYILYSQNTVLWEVKKGDNQSYLLGTYHLLGSHYLDSFPKIKTKLIESDVAIFESIQLEKDRSYIMGRPNSFTYRRFFKKKYVKKLEKIAQKWRYPLRKLRLVEILILIEKEYYKENCNNYLEKDTTRLQFDDCLQNIATNKKLNLVGLENDSIQVTRIQEHMKNYPSKKIKKGIVFWLKAIEFRKDDESLCKLPEEYKRLSVPYKFEEKCLESDALIRKRNNEWMPTILANLSNNNCFIAVGLAHLHMECGLIELLKNKGFEVTPIALK